MPVVAVGGRIRYGRGGEALELYGMRAATSGRECPISASLRPYRPRRAPRYQEQNETVHRTITLVGISHRKAVSWA